MALPVRLRPRAGHSARTRQRGALAVAATGAGLVFTLARSSTSTQSAGSLETGLTFLAPPAPPTSALRGAASAAAAATLPAAAANGARAIGAAGMAGAAVIAVSSGRGSRATQLRAAKGGIPLEELKVGEKYDGVVSRVANIGVWVDIGAEKDALWPKMQLPRGKDFKRGEKIEGLTITDVQTGDTPAQRKIRVSGKAVISDVKVNSIIDATVGRAAKFGVFMDIGAASDALCPTRFLTKPNEEYKPGETVKVKVIQIEGDRITISTKLEAEASSSPTGVPLTQLNVGAEVQGIVARVNAKFGIFFNIGAQRDALCPTNQLELPLSEYKDGQKVSGLKISSVDVEKGQVQVSMRRFASDVKEGETLEGTVREKSSFGIFFDAGLASDVLAPERFLSKPSEEYTKGEIADLLVLKVDGMRVTVTTKTGEELGKPLNQFVRGSMVSGKIVRVESMGIFIDVGAMKDAFFRTKDTAKYSPGQELENLLVTKVDVLADQLEVCTPESLEETAAMDAATPVSQLTIGSEVTGKVANVAEFGLFLDIGAERDALWPVSQLPKPISEYKVGDEITGLRITEADPVTSRLAVSTKKVPTEFKEGEEVSGKVTKVMAFGLFVDVGASVDALAPARYLEKEPGEYTQGEELTNLKVLRIEGNKFSVQQTEGTESAEAAGRISIDDLDFGDQIKGIVRVAKDYGVFVDIGMGRRDALMPASLMPEGTTPDSFEPNQEIEVYVAEVNRDNNRVSLSLTEPSQEMRQGKGPKLAKAGFMAPGDQMPDPKFWAALQGEDAIDEEGIPWKEWAKKYPGLIKFAEQEVELPLFANGYGAKTFFEIQKASPHWIPIPVHLRKEDAGPAEIPKFDFDDFPLDWDKGMKPEIYVKYRTPPMNDPNWIDREYPALKKKTME